MQSKKARAIPEPDALDRVKKKGQERQSPASRILKLDLNFLMDKFSKSLHFFREMKKT